MTRRGTNYNARMGQAAREEAAEALFRQVARSLAAVTADAHAKPCPCGHPWDEHDDEEGCLHGWGVPGALTGCFCERT